MKHTSLLGLALATLTLAIGVSWTPPARAIAYALEPTQILYGQMANTNAIQTNAYLKALVATQSEMLTTENSSYTYLSGVQSGGNGIIELLTSLNDRSGRQQAYNDQALSAEDSAARARMVDQLGVQNQLKGMPTTFTGPQSCSDITLSQGRAGASATAGAGQRRITDDVSAPYSQIAYATPQGARADIIKTRARNCNAFDVQQGHPGCSAVGPAPDADLRPSSLFGSRGEGDDVNGIPPPGNYSLTADQIKDAKQFIKNIAPLPAAEPPADLRKTNAGIDYSIDAKRYSARSVAVTEALANVVGSSVGSSKTVSPDIAPFLSNWQSFKAEYLALFPGETFPDQPSDRALMRFSVFRQFANAQKIAKDKVSDEATLARAQLDATSLNSRLLLMLLERTEYSNVVQAAQLSQTLDPVTHEQLGNRLTALGVNGAGKK